MPPSANGVAPSNGTTAASKALEPGLYVPTVAFFTPEEAVDEATTAKHAVRLAEAGVQGLVTQGSNGEAVHLTHEERSLITKCTRDALDAAGFTQIPVIVGCGAQSARETIQLCKEAAAAGGSATLILPPAYYGGLLNTQHIIQYFRQVADASPIPVLIYNYPGACSGLDLNSDTILALAEHPNIIGVKLTCGNTGKLARIVAGTRGTDFRVFGGSVDFYIQTLAVGGHGIIGGTANIAPKTCLEVERLWKAGKHDAAREVQYIVARGDWVAIQGGFVAVKVALAKYFGYGGGARAPTAVPTGEKLEAQEAGFAELVKTEMSL